MQAIARKPLAPETEETVKDQSLSSMKEDRSRGGPTEDLEEGGLTGLAPRLRAGKEGR